MERGRLRDGVCVCARSTHTSYLSRFGGHTRNVYSGSVVHDRLPFNNRSRCLCSRELCFLFFFSVSLSLTEHYSTSRYITSSRKFTDGITVSFYRPFFLETPRTLGQKLCRCARACTLYDAHRHPPPSGDTRAISGRSTRFIRRDYSLGRDAKTVFPARPPTTRERLSTQVPSSFGQATRDRTRTDELGQLSTQQ